MAAELSVMLVPRTPRAQVGAAQQPLGQFTVGIVVALVAQELDARQDRLLDLIADRAGGSVVVLERAPRDFRGGNSRHTCNLRCAHDAPTAVLTESYTEDEFYADLLRVNAGETDESLARLLICRSKTCTEWMSRYGVRFQAALRGTLHLSRTNAFFLGGGKALMNAYYAAAERMGIDVLYDADVVSIDVSSCSVRLQPDRGRRQADQIQGTTLVLASGGFESNLSWLKDAWGDAADNFIIRGTPHNTGAPLRALLDAGASVDGVTYPTGYDAVDELLRSHR